MFSLGKHALPNDQPYFCFYSNLFFDALTLITTYELLHWMLKLSRRANPVIFFGVIALDVILAVAYSYASLAVGLGRWDLHQLYKAFIDWNDPWFFIMHSSMLPMAVYLLLLILNGLHQMVFSYIFKAIRHSVDFKTLSQKTQESAFQVIALAIFLKVGLWDYFVTCILKSEWADITSFVTSSLSSPFHLAYPLPGNGIRSSLLLGSFAILGFTSLFKKLLNPVLKIS